MPELPEVEVVRRGLDRGVVGRRIATVTVAHPRAVRRHLAGAGDFTDLLAGRTIRAARRRGKYLWLPLDSDAALLAHLGMSGQLLVTPPDTPEPAHLRVRFGFDDGGPELRFVDQRTFGGLSIVEAGDPPPPIAHIAPDPLEPAFDPAAVVRRLRTRRTGIKRALLDQSLVSGVGNIYADEALWRARLHYARGSDSLRPAQAVDLLDHVRAVLLDALGAGGTSFDRLYLSAEGDPGRFQPELAVYGREGEPCPRCGTPVRREPFMNRSSHLCPRCQPRPRQPRW